MGISENWSRENLAWAAGLFEGEGCITLSGKPPSGKRVVLELGMTDEDVVKKFHAIVGVGHVGGPYHPSTRPNHHKPHWRWTVTGGRQAQAVLAALWPFLCLRRKAKAEEAIRFFAAQQVWTKHRKHCPKGHEYTTENTYLLSRGGRACKICARSQSKVAKLKKQQNVTVELQQSPDRDPEHAAPL